MIAIRTLVALFLLITVAPAGGLEAGLRTFTDNMERRSLATIGTATAEKVTLRGQGGQEVG